MQYLQSEGFYGIHLEQWQHATGAGQGVPGRAVIITFDDAYLDFLEYAWPILQRYGFPATVFVVTGLAGGQPAWHRSYGEPAPLLSWLDMRRLADDGVAFGSHTVDHPFLTSLRPKDMMHQGLVSRDTLEQQLGFAVTAIAYPYGDHDGPVRTVMADCGYQFGLTVDGRRCRIFEPRMMLPRVEIVASDDLGGFAAKVGSR